MTLMLAMPSMMSAPAIASIVPGDIIIIIGARAG
jgi:hypothetical protein